MSTEEAERIAWERELSRLYAMGIWDVPEHWKRPFLESMAGKNEVAGILTKDVLRTSWLYRVMERTVEWMQRWL